MFLCFFPQPFRNVKTTLRSWANLDSGIQPSGSTWLTLVPSQRVLECRRGPEWSDHLHLVKTVWDSPAAHPKAAYC